MHGGKVFPPYGWATQIEIGQRKFSTMQMPALRDFRPAQKKDPP
jgi:hypothetical protein